ncbi:MAG: N-6 DNA methylase [Planctomycetaceae bacterium]|jgi:adenine-specific DNA-methyltransferase|nr:N-6 DNA methylase [Planctomycetaceae bacterium]
MSISSFKFELLRKLVDLFKSNILQYKSVEYDDSNVRIDFIDKFFELLDWDIHNEQGLAETHREVICELENKKFGGQKVPDYCFRVSLPQFFVEVKKPIISIKENSESSIQLRRYAYTARLPLSILTNFEEFAVYDTRIKINKNDKATNARIFYCTFDDYEKYFDYIYNLFSKTAIQEGSFEHYVNENKRAKGVSEIDKEFLNFIEDWRIELAKNIAANNPELSIDNLNIAVQKIIDRILFLRIAEDKGIEDYGVLQRESQKKSVYRCFNRIFSESGKKYNADLFKHEKWLENISIDDKVLCNITGDLYFPECPYALGVLPVEILGNIYENFLGKVIRLSSGHRVKIEAKSEIRKTGGVFYTPQYIVDYIVQNTVGTLIKDKTPEEIAKIKIVDPACGSGSFLIRVYQFLLNYHLDFYTQESNKKSALKYGKIFETAFHSYRLTITEKQQILQNNIFGVDIDSQAVEVTKLSLYLKLLENEGQRSEGQICSFNNLRLLPDIDNNIKSGNSLIGTDYFAQQKFNLSSGEQAKLNCFDWEKEFPDIFKKNGGFDIVIGNPPYLKEYTDKKIFDDIRKSYMSKYYQGKMDLWYFFVCLGIDILRNNGQLGFIVPNNWTTNTGAAILRNKILDETKIEKCIDFADFMVFKDAGIQTMIFILSKIKPSQDYFLSYSKILNKNISTGNLSKIIVTKNINEHITDIQNFDVKINVQMKDQSISLVSEYDKLILDKIEQAGNFNLTENEIGQGIVGAPDNCFLIKIKKNFTLTEQAFIKNFYTSVDRYISPDRRQYLLYLTKSNLNNHKLEDFPNIYNHFEKYKSILNQAKIKYKMPNKPYFFLHRERDANMFIKGREKIISAARTVFPKFYYTTEEFYGSRALFFIQTERINLKYLVGILNSNVINFWLRRKGKKQGSMLQVDKIPLLKIPIVQTTNKTIHNKIVELVDKIIQLKQKVHAKQKAKINTDSDSDLQDRIEKIDQQIDQEVYSLYGLKDNEIMPQRCAVTKLSI